MKICTKFIWSEHPVEFQREINDFLECIAYEDFIDIKYQTSVDDGGNMWDSAIIIFKVASKPENPRREK